MLKYQSEKFSKSAMFALNGLRLAFKSQRNFRKHMFIACCGIFISFILKLDILSLCLIFFSFALTLSMELINSCIEFIMDAYYKNKWAKLAKLAKDMAAGSVLIMSIASVTITTLLCLNKIFMLYF